MTKITNNSPSKNSMQLASQCWCDDDTSSIEMDTRLATAFAKRLDELKAASISHAFETIKQAMIDDDPSKLGSYAHGWHCNIAMALFDEMQSKTEKLTSSEAHQIANQAARRFMKNCFDVETKND